MQVTLANWRSSPYNRWAFHHVRELIPSADIANDPRHIRELPFQDRSLDVGIDPDTDGMAIVHRGKLVFEHYANGMTAETPHILMSVSKSMLGLLAAQIGLDAARQVADIVPEVRDTAYRGATVRDLLDMRAGIVWDENYLATSGPIVEYRKATGWNPLGPGEAASDLHSFYASLTEAGAHGGAVHYVSPNTDLLGWVIERASGRRYADLMSELVWKKVGAERSAYITVDRLGAPRCAGGMCVTLRDLARVGQWMIEENPTGLKKLEAGGETKCWAAGDLARYFRGLRCAMRRSGTSSRATRRWSSAGASTASSCSSTA